MSKIFSAIAALIFSPAVALAAKKAPARGLGDLSEGFTAIVAAASEALSYILIAAGVAFFFGAIIKYKAHRDNPSQVRLSEPLFLLVLAIALIALPFVQYIVGYNPGVF